MSTVDLCYSEKNSWLQKEGKFPLKMKENTGTLSLEGLPLAEEVFSGINKCMHTEVDESPINYVL